MATSYGDGLYGGDNYGEVSPNAEVTPLTVVARATVPLPTVVGTSASGYGAGTYGSGTYGEAGVSASVTLTTVTARAAVAGASVAVVRNPAITTTTVAASVLIPTPRMGGFVAGDDVLYLVASHDPSVAIVAHRGTPKRASHAPALSRRASHTTRISKTASANRPI